MIVGRYKGDLCISSNRKTIIFDGEEIKYVDNNLDIIDDIEVSMDTIELKSKGEGSKFHVTKRHWFNHNNNGIENIIFILGNNVAYYIIVEEKEIKVSNYEIAKNHINKFKVDKYVTIKNESNLRKIRDKGRVYANIEMI